MCLQVAVGGSEGDDSTDEDSADEDSAESDGGDGDEGEGEEQSEPLSLKWPDTRHKQATYLLLLPIMLPLWLTLPDVRNPVRTHNFFLYYATSIW